MKDSLACHIKLLCNRVGFLCWASYPAMTSQTMLKTILILWPCKWPSGFLIPDFIIPSKSLSIKAYIPLRRKTTGVGSANMLVSKNAKFALSPTRNIKFVLPRTQLPSASQWNIGCVGSLMQNCRVGHVHFMLFVLISFALVTQRESSLQWNMGLT